jgi:hypothetical protein
MNEMIEEITRMFALRESLNGGFEGLLVPNQKYVHAYNQAALLVYGKIDTIKLQQGDRIPSMNAIVDKNIDVHMFNGGIRTNRPSIDDSGAIVHGPLESFEKASKRIQLFKEFIAVWHPMMPPIEDLVNWGKTNCCHVIRS